MKSMKNDEAVSPVIGVILMVAITVILAAVIAAFVFGMGTPTATPQASLKIKEAKVGSPSANNITIEHRGGDALKLADVKLVVYNTTAYKSTFDPLIDPSDASALSAGSTLILKMGTTRSLWVDTTNITTLTAPTGSPGYSLQKANDVITIELWYRPNGQQLAKLEAATTS